MPEIKRLLFRYERIDEDGLFSSAMKSGTFPEGEDLLGPSTRLFHMDEREHDILKPGISAKQLVEFELILMLSSPSNYLRKKAWIMAAEIGIDILKLDDKYRWLLQEIDSCVLLPSRFCIFLEQVRNAAIQFGLPTDVIQNGWLCIEVPKENWRRRHQKYEIFSIRNRNQCYMLFNMLREFSDKGRVFALESVRMVKSTEDI